MAQVHQVMRYLEQLTQAAEEEELKEPGHTQVVLEVQESLL